MRGTRGKRPYAGLATVVACMAAALFVVPAAFAAAINTTDDPGFTGGLGGTNAACLNGQAGHTDPATNCNIYAAKTDVFLSGSPTTLDNGTYFFAVLSPGGQPAPNDGGTNVANGELANLSDNEDAWTNREFSVSGGTITMLNGSTHAYDAARNLVQLAPYANTPNPGGVYILAVCKVPNPVTDSPGVNPRDCKYDAFKVKETNPPETPPATGATATKDAAGAYKTTYTWGITKVADATSKSALNGTVQFTYTVHVTHNAGANSEVKVTGTISVFNGNTDLDDNTVPMDINSLTDSLSGGATVNCTVTGAPSGGGTVTLSAFQTDFAYSCDLGTTLPTTAVTNTVTVGWGDQDLDLGGANLSHLAAGSSDFATGVTFTQTKVDDCTTVSDPIPSGGSSSDNPFPTTVCVGQVGPPADGGAGTGTTAGFTYVYNVTYNVPAHGCTSFTNTATESTDNNQASVTVSACRVPPLSGALTIGFWQNKNGQGIITRGASTASVCNSGTWLRGFNPFMDLSATATCAQVATYVTNVIKAANASGAAMNAMLKAQMLATALDVYFSDPALGGNQIKAANPIGGLKIDLTQICKMIDGSGGTATCSGTYQNVSAAFGGATSLTVLEILTYAAGQSNSGGSVWYGQVKATQELAKNTFDAINNQVAFLAP
jgi:hypothetical protein